VIVPDLTVPNPARAGSGRM